MYDCLVIGQSQWAQAKLAAYRLYTHSVDDPKAPLQLQLRLVALYECYIV